MNTTQNTEKIRRTFSVLVENRPGVLSIISRLFSRNGFNIDSFCSGPTTDPNLTRITIPDSVTSMGQSVFSECDGLTIRGYAGSFAQKYAENYDIPFADLNSTNTLLGDVDENGTLESTDIFNAMY